MTIVEFIHRVRCSDCRKKLQGRVFTAAGDRLKTYRLVCRICASAAALDGDMIWPYREKYGQKK